MKFWTMFVVVSMMVFLPASVSAQISAVGYGEVRYDFNGQKNPSAPAATNYSDLAACVAGYTVGADACLEGRWQVWKNMPISVGVRFQYQYQAWTARDEYLLGPTLQIKLGKVVDVTLRLDLLVDLQDGDMGIVHPYLLLHKQWQGKSTYQLNLQFHYQWLGSDRYQLSEGYYDASEHQVMAEIDGAWHPAGFKWIFPLAYVGGAGYFNTSETHTSAGVFPAQEKRGMLYLGLGARGEIQMGKQAVLWYQARVGYQCHFGDHHLNSPHGVAFMGSLGIYIKHANASASASTSTHASNK